MHCASIVLNIAKDKTGEFERGFREMELPRFKAWNELADANQIEGPFVFGGDTIVTQGP